MVKRYYGRLWETIWRCVPYRVTAKKTLLSLSDAILDQIAQVRPQITRYLYILDPILPR